MGQRKSIPVFYVTDVHRSVEWYQDVLGFQVLEVLSTSSTDMAGLAVLTSGSTVIMLSFCRNARRLPAVVCDVRIPVDDFADLRARLEKCGVVAYRFQYQEPFCTEFGVQDPDGYIIGFTQSSTTENSTFRETQEIPSPY